MLRESYPYYLANEPIQPSSDLEVTDKYSGEVVTRVALADEATIDRAIGMAAAAAPAMARLASCERAKVLEHCVSRFRERSEELARGLCLEAGKPIRDARAEVGRLIDTFAIAAGEATRIHGEVLPLDITPRSKGYRGMTRRVRPTPGLMVLCAAAGLGFGALNEVIEFAATLLVPETNVGGYLNTGWDLVANLFGATVAVTAIWISDRSTSPEETEGG